MKNFIIFSILIVSTLVSCSDDSSNPISPDDTTAPNTVTDLRINFSTGSTVMLLFTAPGDDDVLGRVTSYEVGYSTTPITSANYFLATAFSSTNRPHVGGVDDTVIVTGLAPNTKYYFALKSVDDAANWSQISNIDSASTLHAGTWTVYNRDNSDLLSNDIIDIQFDGGVKYISTAGGVSKYDNTTWNTLLDANNFPLIIDTIINPTDTTIDTIKFSIVNSIAIENSNRIWFGTQSSGVALHEGDSTIFYRSNDSGLLTSTRDIMISQDKLWVGTLSNGLHAFDLITRNSWKQYVVPTSSTFPGDGIITTLGVDTNNAIWTGLNLWGASVLENGSFSTYGSLDNFTNQAVWDIHSSGNTMLFGTDAGAFMFSSGIFTNYQTTNSELPDNVVTAVVIDNQGTKWFGTRFGLVSLSGTTWTLFTTSNSFLPDNWINTLNVDMFGNLWIGTKNGLVQYFE